MKQLVDEIYEVQIDELNEFKFPVGYPFGLITYINDVKYEFLIHLKENSERLIFCGSGALNVHKTYDRTRPHFNRWSWSAKFSDSIVYYNDPTLYIHDDIRGGYGVGTKDDYYLEKIAMVSEIMAKNLKLKNKDILFYGSSAGGFMSLMLSILVKDSFSICDIPQFYVNELWYIYWPKMKEHIFTNMEEEDIFKEYNYRLNVIEMMKREKYVPNSIIILDCTVKRDFDMQYLHFFRDLEQLPYEAHENNLKLIINGKYEGHGPLNMYETMHLIEESKFINDSLNFKKLNQKEYQEYLDLKEFKRDVLKLLDPDQNGSLRNADLDEKYEKIYNDLIANRNKHRYNSNLLSFLKIKTTKLFDAEFYITEYNLDISKEYALLHYLDIGFIEGKNPCKKFYGDIYLDFNPDVKKSGMNPLVHYELYGKNEGRLFPFCRL